MPIGDYGGNNYGTTNNSSSGSGSKLYESEFFSRIRIKNEDLSLGCSFKNGLLIWDISKVEEGFKYTSLIKIYLSPTKATLFANEIDEFRKYYNTGEIVNGKAFGVNAGMNDKVSFIAVYADTDLNVYLTIGKFDSEGQIIENYVFKFNTNYHFSLEWENIESMDNVAKSYNNLIELDQVRNTCYDFGRYMNGSLGYSCADINRYELARVLKKMDPIYDKLGIERFNNGRSNYQRNSFLENAKSVVNSDKTTIDEMEDLFD